MIWRLKHGADKRIRSGHPWVFSNELDRSPKGAIPGLPIILEDNRGSFLAAGYGNPHSLIAFRALSFHASHGDPTQEKFILNKCVQAWKLRANWGLQGSYRLCFSEGDYLPGLIIDRYLLKDDHQVLSVQLLTAGMQLALCSQESQLVNFFQQLVEASGQNKLSDVSWDKTSILLRNDVQIRKLEGLEPQEPKVLKRAEGVNLKDCELAIMTASEDSFIWMNANLVEGQKTGFFLDQSSNIRMVARLAVRQKWAHEPVRILDLCCYAGQWGASLAQALIQQGFKVHVTAVDVSQTALELAQKNISKTGAFVEVKKMDVLEHLDQFDDKSYDIVIADPPAFIKAKKDLPTGKHGYLKLNTQAFRIVRKNGIVVSCSCSGLFEEIEMMDTLRKSIQRSSRLAQCVQKGGHAVDHPLIVNFPEGFYLKMFTHIVTG